MFYLIVVLSPKSLADAASVETALLRMTPLCQSEEGCVQWHAYRPNDGSGRFILVEHWETEALWRAHGDGMAIQTIYVPDIVPRVEREVLACSLLTSALD
jgi:quinol monooxygenase YgiN